MTGRVKRPNDIPQTRRFDGKPFTFKTYEFGRNARQSLKAYGEDITEGPNEHYRVIPYDNVLVPAGPNGEYRERRIWVLFVHWR